MRLFLSWEDASRSCTSPRPIRRIQTAPPPSSLTRTVSGALSACLSPSWTTRLLVPRNSLPLPRVFRQLRRNRCCQRGAMCCLGRSNLHQCLVKLCRNSSLLCWMVSCIYVRMTRTRVIFPRRGSSFLFIIEAKRVVSVPLMLLLPMSVYQPKIAVNASTPQVIISSFHATTGVRFGARYTKAPSSSCRRQSFDEQGSIQKAPAQQPPRLPQQNKLFKSVIYV